MNYKANFKVIILIHLIGIMILGAAFTFVGPANGVILKWIIATLFVSFVIQLLLFTFKPKWFADKTSSSQE